MACVYSLKHYIYFQSQKLQKHGVIDYYKILYLLTNLVLFNLITTPCIEIIYILSYLFLLIFNAYFLIKVAYLFMFRYANLPLICCCLFPFPWLQSASMYTTSEPTKRYRSASAIYRWLWYRRTIGMAWSLQHSSWSVIIISLNFIFIY